jgi:hypothetical protein
VLSPRRCTASYAWCHRSAAVVASCCCCSSRGLQLSPPPFCAASHNVNGLLWCEPLLSQWFQQPIQQFCKLWSHCHPVTAGKQINRQMGR